MGLAVPSAWMPQDRTPAGPAVRIRLVRNATCIIRYGGRTLLLDPFLSEAAALPAFTNTPNPRPNPLVPLPMAASAVVDAIDATLLTHTHVDHWDEVARNSLPAGSLLLTQPPDAARVAQAGFTNVRAIDASTSWEGMTITRTGGQHGRGDMARRMGPVSGYVLSGRDLPTIYIAGDTVWCPEVAEAIQSHRPDVVIVNAGEAQFLEGGPIIMGVDDVARVCRAAEAATVIAVHMEAVNHCLLTRAGLRAGLTAAGIGSTVLIPRDGEELPIR
jgi:L-ascorbate metabolism protein UlaG (beta-lactamase superfamily)